MHKKLLDREYNINLRIDKDGVPVHEDRTFKDDAFYKNIKDIEMSLYNEWEMKGLPTEPFEIPDYKKTWADLQNKNISNIDKAAV